MSFLPISPRQWKLYYISSSKQVIQCWDILCGIIPNFREQMLELSGDPKTRKAVCAQVCILTNSQLAQLIHPCSSLAQVPRLRAVMIPLALKLLSLITFLPIPWRQGSLAWSAKGKRWIVDSIIPLPLHCCALSNMSLPKGESFYPSVVVTHLEHQDIQ